LSIESAQYVTQLNPANPPAGDPAANSADHHRLVKQVLRDTFPNLNGPVTSTPAQLNMGVVPTGGIIMWSGASDAVPAGYGLCNGATYSKSDGSGSITAPNLQDCFIVGAGKSYSVGATGGSPNHTHSADAITIAQTNLPNVNFSGSMSGSMAGSMSGTMAGGLNNGATACDNQGASSNWTGGYANGPSYFPQSAFVENGVTVSGSVSGTVSGTVSGSVNSGGHGTSITPTIQAASSLPPYYALAFIMKL
jgi:hypothetical protein